VGSPDAINTAQAIRDYRTPDDGNAHTYHVRISGNATGDYKLVITRNSAFEREDNGINAQDISQSGRVLGHQSGVINVAILDPYNNSYQLLSQLNDSLTDANTDVNFAINAQQVQLGQIDSLEELKQFDVVFIGAYDTHYDLQTLAPTLRQWVEAGGGLIASAPIVQMAGQNYGTPIYDIDSIVPVDTTPDQSSSWQYNNLTISDDSHPITQGVNDFYVQGIEIAIHQFRRATVPARLRSSGRTGRSLGRRFPHRPLPVSGGGGRYRHHFHAHPRRFRRRAG
jgi:hypothetical protein